GVASGVEGLRLRRGPEERIGRLKGPAGLEIGAVTPEEIAVSILAEIVQTRRAVKPLLQEENPLPVASAHLQGKDPVCGMLVEIATARHRSDVRGRAVYFCCDGCSDALVRAH